MVRLLNPGAGSHLLLKDPLGKRQPRTVRPTGTQEYQFFFLCVSPFSVQPTSRSSDALNQCLEHQVSHFPWSMWASVSMNLSCAFSQGKARTAPRTPGSSSAAKNNSTLATCFGVAGPAPSLPSFVVCGGPQVSPAMTLSLVGCHPYNLLKNMIGKSDPLSVNSRFIYFPGQGAMQSTL